MRYIVITPAHNEEQFIRGTIESVINQDLLPTEWVIVNDKSTDSTPQIVQEYVQRYSWIKLVNNTGEETRAVGAKVVRTFYKGLENIQSDDYKFLVKLDADVELPSDYFKKIAGSFQADPKIGICSGYCVIKKNGAWVEEKIAYYHTRGPIKAYRTECFKSIGGIKEVMGWDGIDDMSAMSKGWTTRQLRIAVKHFRPTGHASDPKSLRLRQGKAYYQRGYDIILLMVRMFSKLYRTRSRYEWYLLIGFLQAWKNKTPKIVDSDLEKFTRRFQYRRILRLKY